MRQTAWLVFAVVFILGVRESSACSCMLSGPACQAFWNIDAVFDATVISIDVTTREESYGTDRAVTRREHLVRLEVRQAFKGASSGPIEVSTSAFSSACGYDFKVGERYLVFASKSTGLWQVSSCSATQKYDGTGESAAFLASLSRPPGGGRVFGTVRPAFDLLESTPRANTRVNATLSLAGAGRERVIESSGLFEFSGLEPGQYLLNIKVPAGYQTRDSTVVNLPDARACAEVDVSVAFKGRITGILRDAAGKPARVEIEVAREDAKPHPDYGLMTDSTTVKEDGTFEISRLAPGRYIIGVNLDDLPNERMPYPRIVYPADGTGDAVITIGLDQTHDIGEWRLPPALLAIKVSGIAVWPDGQPASGVRLQAWDVTGNPVDKARGAGSTFVTADGLFTIELRQGRTYSFSARDGSNRLVKIDGRLQVGDTPPASIRLVLARTP